MCRNIIIILNTTQKQKQKLNIDVNGRMTKHIAPTLLAIHTKNNKMLK